MTDNNFRTGRSRDPLARSPEPKPSIAASDPLAELARLIGQSDPYHDRGEGAGAASEMPAPGLDWVAGEAGYEEPDGHTAGRYGTGPEAGSYSSAGAQRSSGGAREADYENDPRAGGQFFSGTAARFTGFRGDARDYGAADETHEHAERYPPLSAEDLSAPAPALYDDGEYEDQYAAHQPGVGEEGGQTYPVEDYYGDGIPTRRRRRGLVVLMAVLGVAVLGSAGAFAYRAMFGASVLPTLPPIIKASDGPNKIVPGNADGQNRTSGQAATTAGAPEKLVSHEEQPLNVQESSQVSPRVVSTIPIVPTPSMVTPDASAAAQATAPSLVVPPPMAATPPATTAPVSPPPQSASASPQPKKIHTVVIRADKAEGAATSVTPSSAHQATRAAAAKPNSAAPTGRANEPLSLVPTAQSEPIRTRTRTARDPASGTVETKAASGGGGYAVQVTSQRSEAEAHAAFRSLQAKYSKQLGGREPIVRRADLGSKGTFYRALVGPFASVEEATGLCSSLKAAGGNCLVQRN